MSEFLVQSPKGRGLCHQEKSMSVTPIIDGKPSRTLDDTENIYVSRTNIAPFQPLFAALFHDGYIELRALYKSGASYREFVRPHDTATIEWFLGEHLNGNIYFGVAGRKTSKDGTASNLLESRALWAGLDF